MYLLVYIHYGLLRTGIIVICLFSPNEMFTPPPLLMRKHRAGTVFNLHSLHNNNNIYLKSTIQCT